MTGVGSHELAPQARTTPGRSGRRPAHGSDPFAAIRSRARTEQQRVACETMIRHLARCQAVDGDRIDRTWRQLAKGLGKDVDGLTDRQCRDRYRSPIRRTIDYLIAWGLAEERDTLYEPNGEGRCIVVVLKAGVAQSVRAGQYGGGGRERPRRGPHVASGGPPGRGGSRAVDHFFSGEVDTPSRERSVVAVDVAVIGSPSRAENGGASARAPSEAARDRFLVHAASRRSLVRATGRASMAFAVQGVEGVAVALAALPEAREAPVVPLARELVRLSAPDVWPAITAQRGRQLEAAARRIDHYAGRQGAWIEQACLVLGHWRDGESEFGLSAPPRSLGALALELRRQANLWRHAALERRRFRMRPLAAGRERQKVKRWRFELRAAERRSPGSGRHLRRPRDV